MKKRLVNLFMSLSLLAAVFTPLVPVAVSAQTTKDDICKGLQATGATCDGQGAEDDVNRVIKVAINLFSFIVGVAAVIMIIVGGFKYIISSGDSGNVNSAKNTILYAIIGLVIVALAQVIVRFVLTKTT